MFTDAELRAARPDEPQGALGVLPRRVRSRTPALRRQSVDEEEDRDPGGVQDPSDRHALVAERDELISATRGDDHGGAIRIGRSHDQQTGPRHPGDVPEPALDVAITFRLRPVAAAGRFAGPQIDHLQIRAGQGARKRPDRLVRRRLGRCLPGDLRAGGAKAQDASEAREQETAIEPQGHPL